MSRRNRKISNIKKQSILNQETFSVEDACQEALSLFSINKKNDAFELIKNIGNALPESTTIINTHSLLLWQNKQYKSALTKIRDSLVLDLNNQDTQNIFARFEKESATNKELHRTVKAVVLELNNNIGILLNNLCHRLLEQGHYKKVVSILENAIAEQINAPDEIYIALSVAYKCLGEYKHATEALQKAKNLTIAGSKHICFTKSELFVKYMGIYSEENLQGYENRFTNKEDIYETDNFWENAKLGNNQHILIQAEQGIGDEIKFAGQLRAATDIHKNITFTCSDKLLPLFRHSFPDIDIRSKLEDVAYDFKIFSGSLPLISYRIKKEHYIPKQFLTAPEQLKQIWKNRIEQYSNGKYKIGICFHSGNRDLYRESIYPSSDDWAELFKQDFNNIVFFNASYTYDAVDIINQIAENSSTKIVNFEDLDQRDDLLSTAAYLYNMDLIISTGTAVDELSAALGVNVWKILNNAPNKNNELSIHNFDLPNTYRIWKHIDQDWSCVFNIVANELVKYTSTGIYPTGNHVKT